MRPRLPSLAGHGPWLLLLAAAAVVSVVVQGFDFGAVNNALQVPILLHAAKPELFPNDPFVATLGSYFSVFWWLLAKFAVADWSPVFLVLHWLARLATLAGVYLLLDGLTGRRRESAWAAALFGLAHGVFGVSEIGGHELLGNYVHQTSFANAGHLIALALALRGRLFAAFCVAGIVFDLNAFFGAWTLAVLTALAPMARRPWKDVVGGMLAFALIAAPTILWMWQVSVRNGALEFAPYDYRVYLREYFAAHFFIDAASLRQYLSALEMLLASLAALWLLPRRRELATVQAAQLALFAVGAVLPYVTARPALLNLHLLRVDGLVQMVGAVSVLGAALLALGGESRARWPLLAAALGLLAGDWHVVAAGCALAVYAREPRRPLGIAAAALLLVSAAASAWLGGGLYQELWTGAALAALVALAVLLGLSGEAAVVPLMGVMAADFAGLPGLAAAALLAVGAAAWWRSGRLAEAFRAVPAVVPVLVFAVIVALSASVQRLSAGDLGTYDAQWRSWVDVQRWARANTRIEAVFAVPISIEGFSVFSERGVFVDYKQGAAAMWQPAFYWSWKDRLNEQGRAVDPSEFAERHGVSYLVVQADNPGDTLPSADWQRFRGPVVYRNQHFVVFATGAAPLALGTGNRS